MQARQLPARHGVLWLIAGLQLFRRNPPLLTALTFAYLFAVLFLNLLPFIGPFLLPLALPTITAIVASGVRALEQGRPVTQVALLHGLAANRIGLLRLGGLHLLASVAVLSISVLIEGGPQSLASLEDADPAEMLGMLARLLLIAAPVLTAFWFAPLLTAWDGVPALKSVFFSFIASLRNWRAFAVYGLAIAVVGVVIPGLILLVAGSLSPTLLNVFSVALRMLLVFVMAPVLMASVYLSYRDVFHAVESEVTPPSDA
ncbi:MAG: BPSS1780 family membrane protein [Sulfurisoma sp.]|nr:BPSS1780 family membrane protein [Sulfurisoma sp.]